jgi:4a-hydroxytetrahydrobiopterin dehydratase
MNEKSASTHDLQNRHCGTVLWKLDRAWIETLQKEVSSLWQFHVTPDHRHAIRRDFTFENFVAAIAFANRVGELALSENHYPDILIHGGNLVALTLRTDCLGGLSFNDFILAAKIDQLR